LKLNGFDLFEVIQFLLNSEIGFSPQPIENYSSKSMWHGKFFMDIWRTIYYEHLISRGNNENVFLLIFRGE